MSNNNENKLSFKKKWVIVIFPESKDYSVIPTNWLVDKEKLTEGTIKFCRWPLTRVTSNELKCADDPEPSWETYRVKIVGHNKTYDNFSKAWHQKFVEESSATENEENHVTKNKQLKSNYSDSDKSDDEDNSGFYTTEECNNPCVNLQTVNPCPTTSSLYNMLPAMPPSNIPIKIDDYSINVDETPSNSSSLINSNTSIAELQPSVNTSHFPMTTRSYTHGFDDLNPKLIEVMNNLYKENVATNLMLNRVMVKIEGIEANLQNKNLNTDSIYLDTEFLTLFPINFTNGFNLIENKIQNSSEFVSKLESFLKSVGGTNPKNHLNRVLAKLFTNEFGIKCSWTGRGKNIETKIGDSYLIKTTKKIIKEVSTSLFTESDFDKTVSDWLRHANTRHSRIPNI